MKAIANCMAAFKGITTPTQNISDLKALLDTAAASVATPSSSTQPAGVPRVTPISNPPPTFQGCRPRQILPYPASHDPWPNSFPQHPPP
jgi:hypothetical protein